MTTQPETPRQRRPWRRTAFAAVLLAGTAIGGFTAGHLAFAAPMPNGTTGQATNGQPVNASPVNPQGQNLSGQELPDFVALVDKVKPAVVSITTKLTAQAGQEEAGQAQNGMQQLPFPFSQMFPHPQVRAVEARGSGFIIDANGTVVTNNHVVKGEKSITVTLNDGKTYPATIVGHDPRTDIAVLRIHTNHKLPYIQLGDSSDVKPGQWVVAMGNPFGLGGTVTHGIVSAVSRNIGEGPYDEFIQTDAPINRGNSGGPLFTQQGKVIGMNTAILSPSGGSIGIGFAIPSNMIRQIVSQLEQHGHVIRGFLGVEAQSLTGATAKGLGLAQNSGALVASVQPNTPAAKAGVQPGDVIESVNGKQIANPHDLALNIAGIEPGQDAHLKILRDGKAQDMTVRVEQMPSEETASNHQGHSSQQQVGLSLAPLTPGLRNQLDVPEGTSGAVVQGVQPGSPADTAGLQPGDVIVGVNTRPVHSPSQAANEIRHAIHGKDHAVALRVIRNGQAMFVGINAGEAEGNNQG
ncbi:MAG TPA: DegQ family serine endoprotease [Acetobacteraceae bacterium]|nr:DegQ family serine endoprotease [Acetobacteraceae bacterium]